MTDTMKDGERADFGFEPDPVECWNCGGEGYVSCCFEEYACIDPEGGCDECERRCDICNGRGVLPAARDAAMKEGG